MATAGLGRIQEAADAQIDIEGLTGNRTFQLVRSDP